MLCWPSPAIPDVPPSGHRSVAIWNSVSDSPIPTPSGPLATMYVCGITPYDATHMGHAATYIAFDLINRIWRDCGKQVRYVQNVTDIDEPLLERARATGEDWRDLAARETTLFFEDMTALRVLAPDHYIGAVESIPLVIESVTELERKGATYWVERDLYFRVARDPDYGTRSHLDRAQQISTFAERGGDPQREGKEDPLDPVLWLGEREGEPSWQSPFGAGRPGWHIECCAIAQHYLAVPTMDVKGGGRDLVFPHHEMSAAQARVIADAPFAHVFAHAGLIGLAGEKMSKSRGNLVLVSTLRQSGVDPMAIRLALMTGHYRADRDWSDALLAQAVRRLERWRMAVALPEADDPTSMIEGMRAALVNDIDTPQALGTVDDWVERSLSGSGVSSAMAHTHAGLAARAIDALLGIAL